MLLLKKRMGLTVFVVAAVLLLSAVLLFLYGQDQNRQDLSQSLLGTWTKAIEGEKDAHLELEFTRDFVEYRFVSTRFPEENGVLYTYRWAPLDDNTIWVYLTEENQNNVTVVLKKNTLTLSPPITTEGAQETWQRGK